MLTPIRHSQLVESWTVFNKKQVRWNPFSDVIYFLSSDFSLGIWIVFGIENESYCLDQNWSGQSIWSIPVRVIAFSFYRASCMVRRFQKSRLPAEITDWRKLSICSECCTVLSAVHGEPDCYVDHFKSLCRTGYNLYFYSSIIAYLDSMKSMLASRTYILNFDISAMYRHSVHF